MALLQLNGRLQIFVKRSEFLPVSVLLSRRDRTYAVESDLKSPNLPSFLPSLLLIPSVT